MTEFLDYFKRIGTLTVSLLLLYLIDPFHTDFIFGYLLAIFIFMDYKQLKKSLDTDFTLLALFTFSYAIFYTFNLDLGTQFIFIYAFIPLAFYLLGKLLVWKADNVKQLFMMSLFLGIFFSFIALISVLLNIAEQGFVSLERSVPYIWGGIPPAATVMATYFLFNMCIPAILISRFKETGLLVKIFLFVVFLLSVYCVLRLGSRTQLAIGLFTLIASLLYIVTKQSAKKNILIFILIFVGVNFGLSRFDLNSKSDLMTSFSSRMESKSHGAGTAGGRSQRWEKSLVNLWEEPLGWDYQEFGHSHNLWLDVARVSGILPFLLLVAFSIRSFINTRKVIIKNPGNIALNNLIIAFSLAIFLQFFVEPIFEGVFHLFVFYCLFQGIINGYLQNLHGKKVKLAN